MFKKPIVFLLLFTFGSLWADVSPAGQPFLHGLFTDNMVLQRDMACPIWGWTEPGKEVVVKMGDKSGKAVADATGKWMTKIGPFPAGGPYELTVTGPQAVTLKNVMTGDVWLCSGQSNMEMSIKGVDQSWNEIRTADLPQVRLALIGTNGLFETPHSVDAPWRVCSPSSITSDKPFYGGYSAIAFLFARQIHQETKVPIGLIESCWGATSIVSWSSEESLKRNWPGFQDVNFFKKFEGDVTEAWKAMDPAYEATLDWTKPTFDGAGWKNIDLPQDWKIKALPGFSGVVWFRKDIEIPQEWEGKDLMLNVGQADATDTLWWNGTFVDSFNSYPAFPLSPFFRIPGNLVKKGRNVVAFRISGERGIIGKPEELSLQLVGAKTPPLSLAGPWKYQESTLLANLTKKGRYPERRDIPAGTYHGMIASLAPFAIKGVLWYQGEGDAGRPQYRKVLTQMIADWRSLFGVGDFPFYIVQLAGFGPIPDVSGESGWAVTRESQQQVSQSVPNTGLAVAIDRGEIYNIHPPNKQDVAKRLALVALAKTYGQAVECFGPTYRDMKVEGAAIRLSFEHVAGGLVSRGGVLTGFSIAGADHKFVFANAAIDGETIVVSSPQVPNPVAVRYAWADHPLCNLYNKANLPASPFRTDVPQN